jgi:D-alanyl-D-alanine endopeptidase (penicillin-binding protein 7)
VAAATLVLAQPAGVAYAQARAQSKPTRPPVSQLAKTQTSKSTPVKKAYSGSASRARQARLARARAEARAREAREAATPKFKLDDLGQQVPDIRAAAAIIYDPETNQILWESNAQEERSIASITKVMTALVTLESGVALETPVVVHRTDVFRASTTYLRSGLTVTVDDLLHLLLIGSDNAAARALARTSIYGASGFIERMNQRAAELGLPTTHYEDSSGLLSANVSSAYDMARLIAFASADQRISGIMRKPSHTIVSGKRVIQVSSTNQLVKTGEYDVLGGKTGFIRRSGYCFATLLRLPQTGQQVAVVILGAKSNQGRFWETRHLLNWMSGQTQKLLGLQGTTQQD